MITSQPIRLNAVSPGADAGMARRIVPDGRAVSFRPARCWRCNDQKPRPSDQAFYVDPDLCEPCDEQMAHVDMILGDADV